MKLRGPRTGARSFARLTAGTGALLALGGAMAAISRHSLVGAVFVWAAICPCVVFHHLWRAAREALGLRLADRRTLAELGRRVYARRAALGLSQQQLAKQAGAPFGIVPGVEAGTLSLSIGATLHLARALKMDPADLVRGLFPERAPAPPPAAAPTEGQARARTPGGCGAAVAGPGPTPVGLTGDAAKPARDPIPKATFVLGALLVPWGAITASASTSTKAASLTWFAAAFFLMLLSLFAWPQHKRSAFLFDLPAQRELGRRAEARREGLGLTRQQAAQELGVPVSTLTGVETGQLAAHLDLLAHLAEALGADFMGLVAPCLAQPGQDAPPVGAGGGGRRRHGGRQARWWRAPTALGDSPRRASAPAPPRWLGPVPRGSQAAAGFAGRQEDRGSCARFDGLGRVPRRLDVLSVGGAARRRWRRLLTLLDHGRGRRGPSP
jgi:transcriptional regulator with XRE-family HTH domain